MKDIKVGDKVKLNENYFALRKGFTRTIPVETFEPIRIVKVAKEIVAVDIDSDQPALTKYDEFVFLYRKQKVVDGFIELTYEEETKLTKYK